MADPFATPSALEATLPDGASPDPLGVARATVADLAAHPMGHLGAGIAYLLVTLVLIAVAGGALGIGMLPGLLAGSDLLLFVGGALGGVVYTGLIVGFTFVVFPLQLASLQRALHAQARGEGALGFRSLFDTMTTDAGRVLGFYLAYQLATLVGMLFFYVPGLIVAALGALVMPIIVLEPHTTLSEATGRVLDHVRLHPAWHVATWVLLLVAIVVLELSLVGLLVALPVVAAWQVHAYRLSGLEDHEGR